MQTGGRHGGGSAAGEAMALDALEDCPTREIAIVTVESSKEHRGLLPSL